MEEIWKDIVWYGWHYQISNLWRAKSFKNWSKWISKWWKERILKIWKGNSYWRWKIVLSLFWIFQNIVIARCVAIHFIPNPLNLPLVCHKDETLDKNGLLYNWADNLFWWTTKDNMQDMISKWRDNNNFKKNHPHKWLFWWNSHSARKVTQYSLDWTFIKEWGSIVDIEKELKICNISACCRWKLKSAWWFNWVYLDKLS